MNLKTQQVDYMQAFPQAALEDPVFIRIPHGWYLKSNIMIIALSTTETEFIAISSSTHNLYLSLFSSCRRQNHNIFSSQSKIFEDNSTCIVLETTEIRDGTIKVIKIGMNNNIADIFTKLMEKIKFQLLHHRIMGW
jgi:hypothetical protein